MIFMYASISVYDDTNKCIYKNNLLTPNMVNHDGEYTTYRFDFSITIAEGQAPTMNGKFQHDDIPEPETNKLMDQEVENGRRAADDFVNRLSNKDRIQVCLKDLELWQEFYWKEFDYYPATVVWKDYTYNRIHYMDRHGTFSKGGDIKVWIKKPDDIPEDESEEVKAEQALLKRHKRMMENSMYGLSVNQCAICKKVIYDDKAICDRCFEIAKREGLLE